MVIDGSEFETMGYKVGSSDLRFIVPHSYSENLIIFGGLSNTPKNDLSSYDYGSNEWHEVVVDGTASPNPAQRHGHSAVIYKDFMFVFGGRLAIPSERFAPIPTKTAIYCRYWDQVKYAKFTLVHR